MNFTDAVTVAGNPPPVSKMHMDAVKLAIVKFAEENDLALPLTVYWGELNGIVHFHNAPWAHPERQERLFGIGAPVSH